MKLFKLLSYNFVLKEYFVRYEVGVEVDNSVYNCVHTLNGLWGLFVLILLSVYVIFE